MAKNDVDDILNEIEAFIEEEKQPKRKRRSKVEIDDEVEQEELVEEVKPPKRGRKKKEVVLEIESEVEDVIEETIPVPQVEEVTEEVEVIKTEISVDMNEDEDDDLYLTSSFKPIKKKKIMPWMPWWAKAALKRPLRNSFTAWTATGWTWLLPTVR